MKQFTFKPGSSNLRNNFDPAYTGDYKCKQDTADILRNSIDKLAELQDIFFVHKKYGLIIILQGMDASGKDGIIKNVFSGVNPQGLKISSFSTPTKLEFAHDYLWRYIKALPERGYFGIFNRSYYEEVLIQRVHPEFLYSQNLPKVPKTKDEYDQFWKTRFIDINNLERYLENNGFHLIKIFLNLSKEEQKKRFLRRLDRSAKNWKFRPDDLSERGCWDKYIDYYQDMMDNTSTVYAPWYIVPADNKWYSRTIVCDLIVNKLTELDIHYPHITYGQKRSIIESKNRLLNEDIVPLSVENPCVVKI